MLSRRAKTKIEVTIPHLLEQRAGLSARPDTIDLGTAENWLIRPELLSAITAPETLQDFEEDSLSYAPGIGGPEPTRAALAALLSTTLTPHKPLLHSHLCLAAGGSAALDALIQQLCNPDDGVLLATPYWSGLDICLGVQNNVRVVKVDGVKVNEGTGGLVDAYRNAFEQARKEGIEVKAVLVCNPTNPTGECYGREELAALVGWTESEGLHFISDEAYALSVHGGEEANMEFTSVLGLEREYRNVSVIYTLSKDFGCSGIRLGTVVSQTRPDVLMACALTIGAQLSTLSVHVATQILLQPDFAKNILHLSTSRLRAAYEAVAAFLRARGRPFVPAVAGVFVFARLSFSDKAADEAKLIQRLGAEGVGLVNGENCRWKERGWFRITFAIKEEKLKEALSRIGKALDIEGGADRRQKRSGKRKANSLDDIPREAKKVAIEHVPGIQGKA